eukprot:3846603-Heterocapsa_arctica.AAC.1
MVTDLLPQPSDLLLAQASPFDRGSPEAESLRNKLLGNEIRRIAAACPAVAKILQDTAAAEPWVAELTEAILT